LHFHIPRQGEVKTSDKPLAAPEGSTPPTPKAAIGQDTEPFYSNSHPGNLQS
jgi:hypothetical protein